MNIAILLPTMRELAAVSGYHSGAVFRASDWGPTVFAPEDIHNVTYAIASAVMDGGAGRSFVEHNRIQLLMVVDRGHLLLDSPVPGDVVIADRVVGPDGARVACVREDLLKPVGSVQRDWSGRHAALDRRLGGRGPRVFVGPVVAAGAPPDGMSGLEGVTAISPGAVQPAELARGTGIGLILAVMDCAGSDTARPRRDADLLSLAHLCQDVPAHIQPEAS